MASTSLERKLLRRIPTLRNLSSRELDEVQDRMVYHSYQACEVMWRTRGPLRFSGYIQSGEIELEYRVDGFSIRTTRMGAGDPLPPRMLRSQMSHATVIARAITDVRLKILPEPPLVSTPVKVLGQRRIYWLWPVLLLLLVIILARDDIVRIASGLIYLSSTQGENAVLHSPRSMSLLKAAQKVERGGAAFAYNEEGYRWFQQNQKWDAVIAFDSALARDPSSAPILNNRGITYFSQGNLPQAVEHLQKAIGQDPNNAVIHYNHGILLMHLQDRSGAIREFREAGFIDPKAVLPSLQEAYLYQQMGDFVKTEQRARRALQLDPSLVPAHMLLGIALYNQGREAEALTSFTQTLLLQPGNRMAAFYQALILGHLKQYDSAIPALQELLLSSTDPGESDRIRVEIDALYLLHAETATKP